MDYLENLMLILTCDCLLTIYRKPVRGECFASIICEQNVSNHEPIKKFILCSSFDTRRKAAHSGRTEFTFNIWAHL
jgi:hypothetical protein